MKAAIAHRPRHGCRQGLTLIELVMVLVILAATAAMVVPLLGPVRDQVDNSTAASGSAEIVKSLDAFKVARGRYPERMDSLLEDESGSFVPYSRLAADSETVAPFFTVEDLDSFTGTEYGRSLNRVGFRTVMDHDPDEADATASGTIRRFLVLDDGTIGDRTVAVLNHANSHGLLAAAGVADLDGDGDYLEHANLDSDGSGNPDVKYVAFGLGQQCEIVGESIVGAPVHFDAELDDYARFIVIFAVFENGDPAQLKTAVDSRRKDIYHNVLDFRASGRADG